MSGPIDTRRCPLRIRRDTRNLAGSRRLELVGPLDSAGAVVLASRLEHHLAEGERDVELDFSGVGFVSSAGIGTLITCIGGYRDAKGDVRLVALPDPILEVFEALQLMDYVAMEAPV